MNRPPAVPTRATRNGWCCASRPSWPCWSSVRAGVWCADQGDHAETDPDRGGHPGSCRSPAADVRTRRRDPGRPHRGRPGTGTAADLADRLGATASRARPASRSPRCWAYGNAELAIRTTDPGCHLTWATLAGIGRVESDHGRFGGATLLPNGEESKPIIGVPLDGNGVRGHPGHRPRRATTATRSTTTPSARCSSCPAPGVEYGADAMGNGQARPGEHQRRRAGRRRVPVRGRPGHGHAGSAGGRGCCRTTTPSEYGQKVFGARRQLRQAGRRCPARHHPLT